MGSKAGVQQVVNEIYQEHGMVKPAMLVDAARPKTSPAHGAFDWDNKSAAGKYRIMQARWWLRQVEIVHEDRSERLVHVPRIEVDDDGATDGEYYRPISVVVQDHNEYKAALAYARAKIMAAKAAYDDLKKAAARETVGPVQINFNRIDQGFNTVLRELSP